MSYDVHIRVSHHPKHVDDEQVEETGFKASDPDGDPRFVVANCLRIFADELEEKARREAAEAEAERHTREVRDRWLERRGLSS